MGQRRTRNGEMAAILNFRFGFVPTFCVFLIFQMALLPLKAIFLQVILLRQQSYDIPDVRKSQGLQKMGWNISWCHLPERTPGPKMEGTFFSGRRKYKNRVFPKKLEFSKFH